MTQNDTIQIPKDHAPYIREYYQNKKREKLIELAEIDTILRQLDDQPNSSPRTYDTYSNGKPTLSNQQLTINGATPSGYNHRWPLIKKARFAIKANERAMSSAEIVDYLIENFEPNFEGGRKRFMSSMSGTLSAKSKPGGFFTRQKNDMDEWEYEVSK